MNPVPGELKKPVSRKMRSRRNTVLETFGEAALGCLLKWLKRARIWKIAL